MTLPKKMIRAFLPLFLLGALRTSAQDDSPRFRALMAKGMVTAYHDENDETSRLYFSQMVDDSDKLTTGRDSEAVLSLKGQVTLYLAPRTRIQFEKLRPGDQGLQCFIRLITGRMVCRLEPGFHGSFEIHAGSVRSRGHGTLFEAVRKEEALDLVSYEGSLVVDYHGHTKMAKANEVIRMENGKFRNKSHHLGRREQEDLRAFQETLDKVRALGATPTPAHP